ncbi:TIGR00255 family protein [Filifactor alocis ATCC 35896]|uniref:TIGR00255 family protein n=1 Tax=Filifactor alocis (strain ATCC 35896 / CCUG 47790 / D40 B5) TaxID=546269 RepID=D6GR57_FILAD|nr:YicC/YloC family endoribonuclease [Filifactor alocis]EFE28148.1 TIGR00255 family protein [Filifactor alocis ATCC 35896]
MFSMTGYGRATAENTLCSITIEMKSINNRYLDIYVRMPRQIMRLEEKVKDMIKQEIQRGKLDVFVTLILKDGVDKKLTLNRRLAEEYITIAREVENRFSLSGGIRTMDLLKFPDVIAVAENEFDEQEILELLNTATRQAVSEMVEMRKKEGQALSKDISARCKILSENILHIESFADTLEEEYQEKLMEKMTVLLQKMSQNIDEQRIIQEAAILADRSSITEEIIRFKSHIAQLLDSLEKSEPIGRKLDFIIQEMNREVNTIGSKSDKINILDKVVMLKSELEKIREQVQNIE